MRPQLKLDGVAVLVRDRGRFHGSIRTSGEVNTQNATQIDGPIVEHVPLVLANLSYTVTFPSHTIGTIELEPNQQLTAAPGYYDKLHPKSGAQVFFSSGVYYRVAVGTPPGTSARR